MKIGAQLYTVRGHMKTLDGLAETLKKIADIGYTTVQLSGTCPYEADWIKEQLAKNGLTCPVTHVNPDVLVENTDKMIADHKVFGCPVIGIGGVPARYKPSTPEFDFDGFVEEFLPVAKRIRDAGLLFGYHNHANEFALHGDVTIIEALMNAFPADVMTFTLDTYWIQAGGADPAAWIRKYTGRAHNIHLKDMCISADNHQHMAPVGCGNMNFPAILEACKDAKSEYLLVEQDDCYGEDEFEALTKSYKYLKSQGLN